MSRNVTDIIYHGGCPDGFTAAWLLNKVFPAATLHPGQYGQQVETTPGGDVIMADFSFKRPETLELAERSNKLVILDHHKTAAEELVDLPENVELVLDMGRSGARITYDWLHDTCCDYAPLDFLPELFYHCGPEILVDYVQDRDLWTKELPRTEDIGAVILASSYEHSVWDELAYKLEHDFKGVVESGKLLLANTNKIMDAHIKTARKVVVAGHEVLAVSIPYMFGSSMAEMLCTGENAEYPFGAYYIHWPWGTQWGLRSRGEFDVSDIAKKFGGGGHKNAAGFKIKDDWGFEGVSLNL